MSSLLYSNAFSTCSPRRVHLSLPFFPPTASPLPYLQYAQPLDEKAHLHHSTLTSTRVCKMNIHPPNHVHYQPRSPIQATKPPNLPTKFPTAHVSQRKPFYPQPPLAHDVQSRESMLDKERKKSQPRPPTPNTIANPLSHAVEGVRLH